MSKKKITAITLIEVILAMWILFIAICFIFEVLRTSYTYVTRTKVKTRLVTLTLSKLEQILYTNSATTDLTYQPFTDDSEYQYCIETNPVSAYGFPAYYLTQVTVFSKGPIGRISIPQYNLKVTTTILYDNQEARSTMDGNWGEGFSPEVTAP
jgi:Tfp pilus assembly protein PilV